MTKCFYGFSNPNALACTMAVLLNWDPCSPWVLSGHWKMNWVLWEELWDLQNPFFRRQTLSSLPAFRWGPGTGAGAGQGVCLSCNGSVSFSPETVEGSYTGCCWELSIFFKSLKPKPWSCLCVKGNTDLTLPCQFLKHYIPETVFTMYLL